VRTGRHQDPQRCGQAIAARRPAEDLSVRPITALAAAMLAALCCAGAGAGEAPAGAPAASAAQLLTAGGALLRGAPRIAKGQLTLAAASLPVEQLVALTFPGVQNSHLDQGVVLLSGEVLAGVVVSLQADKLTLASDHFGTLVLPLAKVQQLVLSPCPLSGFGGGARAGASTLSGATLSNGDQLAGTVSFVNEAVVGINNGRRIVEVARARVAQVRLAPAGPGAPPAANPAKAPGALQHLRLVTGERLDGRVESLDEQNLAIETAWGAVQQVPVSLLASLWSEGGPLTPLSGVRPQAVKQIGQFDEAFAAVDDRNLHGGFLTVAGARAERGLGCQARCELSFQLDGGYSALVGAVGIEDDAGTLGAAAFQVFVDGKVAFNVAARAGAPAQPLVVPLAGAKLLQLVVDFGSGGGLAGAADWCWPCLVRGVTPGG
jgi:hypothetical protein